MNKKLENIRSRMMADGLDALLISKGTDIRYLTGFTGEASVAVLVITPQENYFITDNRFTHQAVQETEGFTVCAYERGSGYYQDAGMRLRKAGAKRCGFRPDEISYADYQAVSGECPGTTLIVSKAYLSDLRKVKTLEEIQMIRRACHISEMSFYGLLGHMKAGMTEIDVANELEYQFRRNGGSGYCFDTIVASGPENGANCHATPSSRRLQEGDLVTIDFGSGYEGYCSDLTRTVAIGDPKDEEVLRIYDTVKRAKEAGERALRPGLCLADLMSTIEGVIQEAGYELPHGPGHGFGLDIHEDPFITRSSDYCMEPGVIHTIEPGIYVPGVAGVRIEDDYLITEDSYERLTNITSELIRIY